MSGAKEALAKLRESGLLLRKIEADDLTETCSIRIARLKNGRVVFDFDGLDQSESHAKEAIRMLSEAIAELTYVDDCPF